MDLENKKVLITGADGFIGSHLTEALLEKGCKVRALSQYNSFNSWGWLEDIPANKNLEVIIDCVFDNPCIKEITKGFEIICD
jgi:nucleoside-diphosphate-sugar epimerase